MKIDIGAGYHPFAASNQVHNSHARFLSIAAGVRGGKTKTASVEFVCRIVKDLQAGKGNRVAGFGRHRRPRLHYWVVAPTAALLEEPKRYLFEILPPAWIERFYDSNSSLWLLGDILIEFKSADNPLHLVASGLHGMWLDEAARIKGDAWLGQLRQRLTDHEGWALFSTTPLGRNWLYDEIVCKDGQDGYQTISWKTADNPYIKREEIESAKRTLPARYFAREFLASFDAFLGNVYDEFTDEAHVRTEHEIIMEFNLRGRPLRSLFRRVVAGVDFGWNSPGSIVVVGDMGSQFIVLDESYASHRIVFDPNMQDATWVGEARRLKDLYGISQFLCDPARPDAIFDFQRAGLPALGAHNEILLGIRKVSEALHVQNGRPRMRVVNRCKDLIRELRNYQWAQNKAGDTFADLPAPNQSDHAADALRYAMAELMMYESVKFNNQAPMRQGMGPIG